MMKLIPGLLLASATLNAYAADYYVVVPLLKKAVSPAVSMTLSPYTVPEGVAAVPYAGLNLGTLLTVLGDATYSGSGVAWQVASGALPAGIQLDPATGALAGTPTTAGTYGFSVRATYKKVTTEQSYQLKVGHGVVLASATLPAATEGQPYTFDFSNLLFVTGDPDYQVDNATFSLGSGALPAGLALSARGVLSGVPTTPSGPAALDLAVNYKGSAASKGYTLPAVASAGIRGVNFASHLRGATIVNHKDLSYFGPNPYWPYATRDITPPCQVIWAINSMLCMGDSVISGAYSPKDTKVSTWASAGTTQYAVVDLGQPRTINTAYFYQADMDGRTSNIQLAIADTALPYRDARWVSIGSRAMSHTDFTAQKLSFAPVTTRYIRVGASVSGWAYVELRGLQLFYE